jgi:hypothetical protein
MTRQRLSLTVIKVFSGGKVIDNSQSLKKKISSHMSRNKITRLFIL